MTFDDVGELAPAWPEVQDGTSYGTLALKVRKKLLARIKKDNDSLVALGVPEGERAMLCESEPRVAPQMDKWIASLARNERVVAKITAPRPTRTRPCGAAA